MSPATTTKILHEAYRPITFRITHALVAVIASCFVYLCFLLLAVLLSASDADDGASLALVHTGGALALLAFWRLGRWGRAKFDCFGAALLLVAAIFRLQALADVLAYGARVESIFRTVPLSDPVISMFLKGELITVMGMLLVACTWRLGVGSRVEHFSFVRNNQRIPLNITVLVYLAALSLNVLERVLGAYLGPLQQVASLAFTFGVAAIYFIAIRQEDVWKRVAVATGLAMPMVFLALGSGMKEEIFFPLIPAGLLYWFGYRNIAARGAAVVVAILVFGIAQMYVHYVRDTAWRSTGDLDISTGELVSGFGQQAGKMEVSGGLDAISSRVNLTTAHAITVTLADHNGYEPMAVFGMIPASVIPRVFWPGKPVMQPGAMHTARILGVNVELSKIRSATAAGFAAELYLGGGWLGLVLGAISYGALLAAAQKRKLRTAPGFGHQALCFVTLYWTLRFDEKHIVYAYTSVLFTVAFIWMLKKTAKTFGLSFEASRSRLG